MPKSGVWYRWRLDGAEVHIWNRGNEWHWAEQPKDVSRTERNFGGPEEYRGDVQDFHVSYAASQPVALRPFTLNRPFVVQDPSAITVHRDHEVSFAVDLPVSVKLELESGVILGMPNTILLTKTWFGDTTSGTACFLWPAKLALPLASPFGSMVRCQIRVRNLTKNPLQLKQFAVYSELLTLWTREGMLVTNDILLEGQSDGSLRMVSLPPAEVESLDLICEAPVGQTDLLIKRGVGFLRNIAGIS